MAAYQASVKQLTLVIMDPATTWSISISPKMKTVLLTINVQIIAQS